MRRKEHSFGIIPLKQLNGTWIALLVKHKQEHWAFPKGHPESGESPKETATRELLEETGVCICQFFEAAPLEEHYLFKTEEELVEKTVTYFLAEVEGEVTIQVDEITDFRWVSLEKAEKLATFPESKRLCGEAFIFLEAFQK